MDETLTLGGISTLDSPASQQLLRRMDDECEARARACEFLEAEFRKAITGDLDAPCVIAPKWVRVKGGLPTACDLLTDALDSKDFMRRAVRILVAVAKERGGEPARLLDDVAKHWADNRADDYV